MNKLILFIFIATLFSCAKNEYKNETGKKENKTEYYSSIKQILVINNSVDDIIYIPQKDFRIFADTKIGKDEQSNTIHYVFQCDKLEDKDAFALVNIDLLNSEYVQIGKLEPYVSFTIKDAYWDIEEEEIYAKIYFSGEDGIIILKDVVVIEDNKYGVTVGVIPRIERKIDVFKNYYTDSGKYIENYEYSISLFYNDEIYLSVDNKKYVININYLLSMYSENEIEQIPISISKMVIQKNATTNTSMIIIKYKKLYYGDLGIANNSEILLEINNGNIYIISNSEITREDV